MENLIEVIESLPDKFPLLKKAYLDSNKIGDSEGASLVHILMK